MQSKDGVLTLLNRNLPTEIQSVNQYTLWGYQCVEWGFPGLKELLDLIVVDEMDHRKLCIERVLRLEGTPVMTINPPILQAMDVPSFLQRGLELETSAVQFLNPAINHCQKVGDNTTATMFTEILADEETHVAYYERELRALGLVGLQAYLTEHRG